MSEPLHASSLSGKRVVVTGGARGIGRELAVTMAAAGAQVAVTARSLGAARETVRDIEARGGQGHAVELDLAVRPSVQSAFQAIVSAMGGVDVLVCNSGIGGPSVPVWDLAEDDWDAVFEVNVTGAFLCAKA